MSKKDISEQSAPEGAAIADAFAGEVPELGDDFFAGARIRAGGTVIREAAPRRGRPPKGGSAKVQQSLRLSPEVLDHFRATGQGWQSRIDEVLLAHVRSSGKTCGASPRSGRSVRTT